MTFETLDVQEDDRGVAYVSLNLPEKRNALSSQMLDDLTDVARWLGQRASVRAVVLSGRGRVFCAGGDLDWMRQQIDASRDERMAAARKLANALKRLNEMPKPLIGRIHGGAFGGGVGIACVCDVVVAEEEAKFGLTETRLGIIPATIGPYIVARMGEGHVRRVIGSGRIFSAPEAAALQIVSRVVAADLLDEAVEAEILPYLSVAPLAAGEAKRLIRSLGDRIDDEVIEETIRRLADIWEGEEAAHGIGAFLNKSKPHWA